MASKAPEYVAALCHFRGELLLPFKEERFHCIDANVATLVAVEWATHTREVAAEPTWLVISCQGEQLIARPLKDYASRPIPQTSAQESGTDAPHKSMP
jgi:hypothetical protein